MVGSIVLAGAVLKLGILYLWNFGSILVCGILVMISCLRIGVVVDGKVFAAYSSVLHITLCVLIGLYVILVVRYMHIVLSPLIFMTVYMRYALNGSRFYIKIGVLMMIL